MGFRLEGSGMEVLGLCQKGLCPVWVYMGDNNGQLTRSRGAHLATACDFLKAGFPVEPINPTR